MDFITYTRRSAYILQLIDKGQLNSPKDLVSRFECSERTIRKMISDLKHQGHDIRYDRKKRKYILNK
jgi:DeoR/GlpR family transcriptional regulator of sugar metabolism